MKKRKPVSYVSRVSSALRRIWLWSELRRTALKQADHCCEECGASKKDGAKLEVHHSEPVDMTKEAKRICDKLFPPIETLDVLCKDCHRERHAH